jgi:outer membrane protein assembly factor BamB
MRESTTDWPGWRGPKRDGHLSGFSAPKTWPQTLTRKWSLSIGEGHSSPILVGNRAFALVRRGETEHTLCIDAGTGKVLWEDKNPAPFDSVIFPAQRLGKAPRSTPLLYQGKLYVIGVGGVLSCLDARTGRALWRKDFSKGFKIPMPVCGASLSPLIDGRALYIHVGHGDEGAFVALDKNSGAELWRMSGEGPGYTSPQLMRIGGKQQLVTAAHNSWIGLDSNSGKLLWSVKNRQNYFNHNSITPAIAGDVLYCGANQRPTTALRVKPAGGGFTAETLWETRDVTMSTSSPVLSGNRLYGVNEKRRGQVVVMDTATGRVLWACDGNKGENVTLVDVGSHIFAFSFDGQLFVYKKLTNGLVQQARYEMADGATWASPALSGNRMLVKGAEKLNLWEVPA